MEKSVRFGLIYHGERVTDTYYRKIVENATEFAIFTMDTDRRIRTWNAGAEEILGWSREEARGQMADIIFPSEGKSARAEKEEQCARENGSASDETWHVKKDGSYFWAIGRMMPISDEAGRITGFVKILMDQTEKKKYQQELKIMNETLEERVSERTEALLSYQRQLRFLISELNTTVDRERDRLAGDLHDNLGQLLAVCKMELRMLQNQIDDKELQASISKATELIEEAIRYTRVLMSDLKPPDEVKKDLMLLMKWIAKRKERFGLKVSVEDDQQEKPLQDDVQALLSQAVRELLFNVVKHAGVDEAVVRLERQGENLRVLVEDKGKGFEPAKQEPVQESEGGFGIFNLRERLELMGGSLNIESEPGKGTNAILVVPLNLTGN